MRFSTGAPVTARDVRAHDQPHAEPDDAGARRRVDSFRDIVGAQAMIDGDATTASGTSPAAARWSSGYQALPDFTARSRGSASCRVACRWTRKEQRRPPPGPAPYFISQHVPGERIVLERNRFYDGASRTTPRAFVIEIGRGRGDSFASREWQHRLAGWTATTVGRALAS